MLKPILEDWEKLKEKVLDFNKNYPDAHLICIAWIDNLLHYEGCTFFKNELFGNKEVKDKYRQLVKSQISPEKAKSDLESGEQETYTTVENIESFSSDNDEDDLPSAFPCEVSKESKTIPRFGNITSQKEISSAQREVSFLRNALEDEFTKNTTNPDDIPSSQDKMTSLSHKETGDKSKKTCEISSSHKEDVIESETVPTHKDKHDKAVFDEATNLESESESQNKAMLIKSTVPKFKGERSLSQDHLYSKDLAEEDSEQVENTAETHKQSSDLGRLKDYFDFVKIFPKDSSKKATSIEEGTMKTMGDISSTIANLLMNKSTDISANAQARKVHNDASHQSSDATQSVQPVEAMQVKNMMNELSSNNLTKSASKENYSITLHMGQILNDTSSKFDSEGTFESALCKTSQLSDENSDSIHKTVFISKDIKQKLSQKIKKKPAVKVVNASTLLSRLNSGVLKNLSIKEPLNIEVQYKSGKSAGSEKRVQGPSSKVASVTDLQNFLTNAIKDNQKPTTVNPSTTDSVTQSSSKDMTNELPTFIRYGNLLKTFTESKASKPSKRAWSPIQSSASNVKDMVQSNPSCNSLPVQTTTSKPSSSKLLNTNFPNLLLTSTQLANLTSSKAVKVDTCMPKQTLTTSTKHSSLTSTSALKVPDMKLTSPTQPSFTSQTQPSATNPPTHLVYQNLVYVPYKHNDPQSQKLKDETELGPPVVFQSMVYVPLKLLTTDGSIHPVLATKDNKNSSDSMMDTSVLATKNNKNSSDQVEDTPDDHDYCPMYTSCENGDWINHTISPNNGIKGEGKQDKENLSCIICQTEFDSALSKASHGFSSWHKYNVGQRMKGGQTVTESKFKELTANEEIRPSDTENVIIRPHKIRTSTHSTQNSETEEGIEIINMEVLPGKNQTVYRCQECKRVFKERRIARRHFQRKSCSQSYICKVCNLNCKSSYTLKKHMVQHSDWKPHKCQICDVSFHQIDTLNEHVLTHLPEMKSFPCNVCDKIFLSHTQLKRHTETHSKVKLHECTSCPKKFRKAFTLKQHMKLHTGEKEDPSICDFCGKSFSSRKLMIIHRKYHFDPKPLKCDICGEGFKCHSTRTYHMIKVHKKNQKPDVLCDFCSKLFYTNRQLQQHVRAYHRERDPFTCETCGKMFTAKFSLKHHVMRVHSNVRPYLCDICGKSFITNHSMLKHKKQHTHDKEFKCDQCFSSYVNYPTLRRHIKYQHEIPKMKAENVTDNDNQQGGHSTDEQVYNLDDLMVVQYDILESEFQ